MQCVKTNVDCYNFRHVYVVDNNVVLYYFTRNVANFKREKTHNFINANTKITKRVKRKVVNLFY